MCDLGGGSHEWVVVEEEEEEEEALPVRVSVSGKGKDSFTAR